MPKKVDMYDLKDEDRKLIFGVTKKLLTKNYTIIQQLHANLEKNGVKHINDDDLLYIVIVSMLGIVANVGKLDNCLFALDDAQIAIMSSNFDEEQNNNPYPKLREALADAINTSLDIASDLPQNISIH